jgi:hypothetical protein
MSAVREGPGRTLRYLKVSPYESGIPPGDEPDHGQKWRVCPKAGVHVGACLGAGGCPVLETLDFAGPKCESICAVVQGLVGCPRLLELHLRRMTVACGEALAAVLAEGAVPDLRHLEIEWTGDSGTDPAYGVAVARVLQASPRPKLRVLVTTFGGYRQTPDDEGVVALADALRAEAYRGLTVLRVYPRSAVPKRGLEALGGAVAEGSWPHLESLDLRCTALSLGLIADAIRWGRLACLQHLRVTGGWPSETAVAIVGALRSGPCRTLRTLSIRVCGAGCGEIARAMEEGSLPRLRVLNLSGREVPPMPRRLWPRRWRAGREPA